MASDTITRLALSRPASLGDLYDIRTETFKDIMIFKKHPIPESLIKTIQCPRVDMLFLKTENFSEKFSKLRVSADFSLSLLAGVVPLSSGTGKYLQQQKDSARAAMTTLMYSMETVVDTLTINSEDLADYVCQKTLLETDATHVVIRVDWGANVFLSFQDNSNMGDSNHNWSSNVETTFKKIVSAPAKLTGKGKGSSINIVNEVALRIYGDILPESGKIPQTTEEAGEFIQSVPRLAKESNNGKGKPVSYGLLPISTLRKIFGQPTEAVPSMDVKENVCQEIVYFFDALLELKQKLTDLYEDVTRFSYCLTEENVTQVWENQKELSIYESTSKIRLKEVITNIRTGKGTVRDFDLFLQDLDKDTTGEKSNPKEENKLVKIKKYVDPKGDVANHIMWIKTLIGHNVLPIGTGEFKNIDAAVVGKPSGDSTLYKVFVYAFQAQNDKDKSRLSKNRNLFLQLLSSKEDRAKFFFVNSDVHPMPSSSGVRKCSSIYCYENGNPRYEDWLEETEKKMKIPIAGTYRLTDNGQFGTYLTELGIWGVKYYGILGANCDLVITEHEEAYRIETLTSFKNVFQTFQLNKEFSELTAIDGKPAQSKVRREFNRLILEQTVDDGTKRVTIREFLDDRLIVTLKLLPGKISGKHIVVTRTFKRV